MKKWWIYIGQDKREFWAESGEDCYLAIRQENKSQTVGFQRAD